MDLIENRLGRETLLTFCTTGILLRTLMSGDDISHVTHIIVVCTEYFLS